MSHHLKFITTHPPYRVGDCSKVDLIRDELVRIAKHQSKLHEFDSDPYLLAAVEEAIECLNQYLDYDPTPNEPGEPPMTMAEMHAGAWKQHLELHS